VGAALVRESGAALSNASFDAEAESAGGAGDAAASVAVPEDDGAEVAWQLARNSRGSSRVALLAREGENGVTYSLNLTCFRSSAKAL
jgi:hypothetical protein